MNISKMQWRGLMVAVVIAAAVTAHAADTTINFQTTVDGTSELVITPDGVFWHHIEKRTPGTYPTGVWPAYADGASWTPVWPGDESNIFQIDLPGYTNFTVSAEYGGYYDAPQDYGDGVYAFPVDVNRGTLTASSYNGYPTILIDDPLPGMNVYSFDLHIDPEREEYRRYMLGDIDGGVASGEGSVDDAYFDPDILNNLFGTASELKRFDERGDNSNLLFTFDLDLAEGESAEDATLTVCLQSEGPDVSTDSVFFYSADATEVFGPFKFEDLGWLPLATDTYELRSLDLSDVAGTDMRHLLREGQLSCQLRDDVSIDYAVLDLQVVPEPATMSLLGLGGVALIKRRKS